MKSLVLLLILIAATGRAEESGSVASCRSQIDLYCEPERDSKDFRKIVSCLIRNEPNLSPQCKQEIQRFAQANRQTRPPSGGPIGALDGLTGMGASIPSISYEGRSLREHNLNTSLPVYKNDTDAIALTLMGSTVNFKEPLILDSGAKVPENLNRSELGAHFSRRLSGQRTWGLRTAVGFAGDKVDDETAIYNLIANYSFPSAEQSRWVLMVMVSNNSPLGTFVPVPGFFYIYRTPRFTGLFGLPIISLQWTPVSPWAFSFSAFGPTLKTEATYGEVGGMQTFLAAAWKQQRYILSDRLRKDDRVTVEEKNFELGLRRPIFRGVLSELAIGNAFDRSVYIGDGLFNHDGGKAKLETTHYLRWSIRATF